MSSIISTVSFRDIHRAGEVSTGIVNRLRSMLKTVEGDFKVLRRRYKKLSAVCEELRDENYELDLRYRAAYEDVETLMACKEEREAEIEELKLNQEKKDLEMAQKIHKADEDIDTLVEYIEKRDAKIVALKEAHAKEIEVLYRLIDNLEAENKRECERANNAERRLYSF